MLSHTVYDPPDRVMAGGEMIGCAGSLKIKVQDAIKEKKPIPQIIDTNCSYWGSKLEVLPNGIIKITNQKFGLEMNYVPEINGDNVKWSCNGKPNKYMPKVCRSN